MMIVEKFLGVIVKGGLIVFEVVYCYVEFVF